MHALRSLARTPGFTFVAVITLALCIGANSAIFSVVNAVLLRPYPWPDSDRLVFVHNSFPKAGTDHISSISIPDYLDHRAGVSSLAESALITGFSANLSSGGTPERVYGLTVTPSLFSLLQTMPALGRAFTEADAQPGAAKTVVLREDFWRQRFAANPAVLGETLRLNGETYTIVGVMPPGFYFPSQRAQLFVPYAFTPEQKSDAQRITQFSTMLGRLRPEATLAQAQREIDAVHRAARARLPELQREHDATGYGSVIVGFLENNVHHISAMLWLLQAAVVAALLIGCANVANLLLTRATARQREFAIRTALGAGRGRLMRQLLAESLVLFGIGGGLGLLVALWGLSAMNTLGVTNLPRGFTVSLDARAVAFTLISALATGLIFGPLPAWSATRANASDALKSAGTRTTASRRQLGLRGGLAVTQIALSLMLLATAALLLQSFSRLQNESPGFDSERVLTASLTLPTSTYNTTEKRAAFANRLTEQLTAIPGVTAAGLTNSLPFQGSNPQGAYEIQGREVAQGAMNANGMIRQVSPEYFSAMGINLLRGRLLSSSDTLGREPVVVIDQFLANRFWPGGDPIGQRIRRTGTTPAQAWATVVGVVGTIKHWDLTQPVVKETLYFPFAQIPHSNISLTVKSSGDPATLISAIRSAVLAVDPEQPIFDVQTLAARLETSLQPQRTSMLLLGVFSGVAVLLAALGIYGVLAFSVGQRTSEFGVRMALGADRANILRLVLRQGFLLVASGLALGLGGYFVLSRFLTAQLFQIAPNDPLTLLLAPTFLAAIALAACLLPARRATRVDPMTALRTE